MPRSFYRASNPVEVEYVYFIQEGRAGPIKIGHAQLPFNRLRSLQTSSPRKLEMRRVVLVHGSVAERLEKGLHKHFAEARMHGEWFEPVPELVEMANRKSRR